MATKKSQRIGIWIIAIALVAGTLGSFLIMILAPKNEAADQARLERLTAEYQEAQQAHQAELSAQYYDDFAEYQSRVQAFAAADVTELGKEDLKEGDGEVLTSESSFTAYYIGWNPDGKIFDSSISDASLAAPIDVRPGGVIKGWTDGVAGMKVGGVRELTIPAELAYGDQERGEDIPANTPLKFVIMVIPTPTAPKMSDELKQLYARLNGISPAMLEGM